MVRLISDLSRDEKINKLSWFAEIFFRRLWNKVDDFGNYTSNPVDLKNDLFPIRDVRIADIIRCIEECLQADLLAYSQADKKFVQIKNFGQQALPTKQKTCSSANTGSQTSLGVLLPSVNEVQKTIQLKENKNDKENEEKERSKEKEAKETERTKENKENVKKESFSVIAERIWKAYPKKDGKKKGIEAIVSALKRGLTEEFLTERVELYKQSRSVKQGFTMMAQGWFNQERYFDESLNQIKQKSSNYDEGFFNITSLNRKLWGKEQVNDNG